MTGYKFELTIDLPNLDNWHLSTDGTLTLSNERGTTTEKIKFDSSK